MTVGPVVAVLPWDTEAIAAEALDILRLGDLDADADRVRLYVAAVVDLIESYVEPPAEWALVPEPLARAAANVTVSEYRRKDAPHGVLNAWSPDDYGPVRISPDWIYGVRTLLLPFKSAWGIA